MSRARAPGASALLESDHSFPGTLIIHSLWISCRFIQTNRNLKQIHRSTEWCGSNSTARVSSARAPGASPLCASSKAPKFAMAGTCLVVVVVGKGKGLLKSLRDWVQGREHVRLPCAQEATLQDWPWLGRVWRGKAAFGVGSGIVVFGVEG